MPANDAKTLPPLAYLNEIFRLADGRLYWSAIRCGTKIGSECGNENPKGYRRVKIDGSLYLVHRIIYFMHYGIDPVGLEVDHRDGNPRNNDPNNLRVAEHGQNQTNGGAYRNNVQGFRGVYYHKQSRKYRADIQHKNDRVTIGGYADVSDAARAYDKKAIELFGEYAKTNFPLEDYAND